MPLWFAWVAPVPSRVLGGCTGCHEMDRRWMEGGVTGKGTVATGQGELRLFAQVSGWPGEAPRTLAGRGWKLQAALCGPPSLQSCPVL